MEPGFGYIKGLAKELVLQMNLRRVWSGKIRVLVVGKRFPYRFVVGETGNMEISWLLQ